MTSPHGGQSFTFSVFTNCPSLFLRHSLSLSLELTILSELDDQMQATRLTVQCFTVPIFYGPKNLPTVHPAPQCRTIQQDPWFLSLLQCFFKNILHKTAQKTNYRYMILLFIFLLCLLVLYSGNFFHTKYPSIGLHEESENEKLTMEALKVLFLGERGAVVVAMAAGWKLWSNLWTLSFYRNNS